MDLPQGFPVEVEAEARVAIERDPSQSGDHEDRTSIPFLTVDPPGSMDLDQAFHAERSASGFLVNYAIADPGWFIEPGGALDRESRLRGQTLYSPDLKVPLYPQTLSEGAASLLSDQTRPSVLWAIELDDRGEPIKVSARRSLVRSRRRLTYGEAQEEIDAGSAEEPLLLLREIGLLRKERESERGGMNLELPEQEIVRSGDRFELHFRGPLPVEEWNAQISLLTGLSAARLMIDGGIGLLRTMPEPEPESVKALRAGASLVGVPWPEGLTYQEFISSLKPSSAGHAGLLTLATRLFRGTGYVAFDGSPPEQPLHHAIAASYAHVTAPLRRLGDRFANEIAVALCAGTEAPAWAREALPHLPERLKESHRKDGELERRTVDFLEAVSLQDRVGEQFEAVVVESGAKGATIQIKEPAIVARCKGGCGDLGTRVEVRLSEANVDKGIVSFEPVAGP